MEDVLLAWAPLDSWLIWLALGWQLADNAWIAGHHLTYSVPVWRPV